MEKISTFLTLYGGNPSITVGFPSQRSSNVLFVCLFVCLLKQPTAIASLSWDIIALKSRNFNVIVFSYISSISFLGDPVESYSYGFIYMLLPLGYILALPVIAFFVAPTFHKLNIISAFEVNMLRATWQAKTCERCTHYLLALASGILWWPIDLSSKGPVIGI